MFITYSIYLKAYIYIFIKEVFTVFNIKLLLYYFRI